MSNSLAKFNLRPNERRLLVAVATAVFIVLNIWLVWPHFNDWGKLKIKMSEAQKKYEGYQAEVNRIPQYQDRLKSLVGDETTVMPEDQAIHLLRTIQNHAMQNGVVITGNSRASSKTNETFLEQTQNISVQSGEKQLVDFLYNLSTGSSMIRVRELNLRPDATRTLLGGNITLVASYQRKAASAPAVTAAATTAPVEKTLKPTEKKVAPADKQPPANNRVSTTNQPRTTPERRPKPTDKPATPTNKRS